MDRKFMQDGTASRFSQPKERRYNLRIRDGIERLFAATLLYIHTFIVDYFDFYPVASEISSSPRSLLNWVYYIIRPTYIFSWS
jgi:hypothetical protein